MARSVKFRSLMEIVEAALVRAASGRTAASGQAAGGRRAARGLQKEKSAGRRKRKRKKNSAARGRRSCDPFVRREPHDTLARMSYFEPPPPGWPGWFPPATERPAPAAPFAEPRRQNCDARDAQRARFVSLLERKRDSDSAASGCLGPPLAASGRPLFPPPPPRERRHLRIVPWPASAPRREELLATDRPAELVTRPEGLSRHRRLPAVRPVTVNLDRLPKSKRKALAAQAGAVDHARPRTRLDCETWVPRPCPYSGCRYNLYLDVNEATGNIKLNFPELGPEEMIHSCALDVAELGPQTLETVGDLLRLTRERVRQVFGPIAQKLRGRDDLRALFGPGRIRDASLLFEDEEEEATERQQNAGRAPAERPEVEGEEDSSLFL